MISVCERIDSTNQPVWNNEACAGPALWSDGQLVGLREVREGAGNNACGVTFIRVQMELQAIIGRYPDGNVADGHLYPRANRDGLRFCPVGIGGQDLSDERGCRAWFRD